MVKGQDAGLQLVSVRSEGRTKVCTSGGVPYYLVVNEKQLSGKFE